MKPSFIIALRNPVSGEALPTLSEVFRYFSKLSPQLNIVDCTGKNDVRFLAISQQADLVVLILPQNRELLDRYFSCSVNPHRNYLYLVRDYYDREAMDLMQIRNRYRINPRRLCVLPDNPRLTEAVRQGNSHRYLQSSCLSAPLETSISFDRALRDCYEKCLSLAESSIILP